LFLHLSNYTIYKYTHNFLVFLLFINNFVFFQWIRLLNAKVVGLNGGSSGSSSGATAKTTGQSRGLKGRLDGLRRLQQDHSTEDVEHRLLYRLVVNGKQVNGVGVDRKRPVKSKSSLNVAVLRAGGGGNVDELISTTDLSDKELLALSGTHGQGVIQQGVLKRQLDLGLALSQLRRRSGLTLFVEVALGLAERAAELSVVAALVVKVDKIRDWWRGLKAGQL
jgi:hypothetical protein